MDNDKRKKILSDHNGFTLVEMIIVLVILAILAAILIPALLGYIDEAKKKQDVINAKNCLTAIQGELTRCYAKYSSDLSDTNDNTIGETFEGTNDAYIVNTEFAANVKAKLDTDPYCVMFATGYYGKKADVLPSIHECYTACYIYYQETKDSDPLYLINGEWTRQNPRYKDENGIVSKLIMDKKNTYNYFKVGPMKGKAIRYFLVINNTEYQSGKPKDIFVNLWNNIFHTNRET